MPDPASHADAIRARISGVEIAHLHCVGTVAGVVVLQAAARNGAGQGRLTLAKDGYSLRWRAPGSETPGDAVLLAGDGTYLLEDGEDRDKWLCVQVYEDYLPTTAAEASVHLADRFENGPPGDDVTAAEAAAGDVETWSIDLVNESDAAALDVVAWIDAGFADRLEISADGSAWSAPTAETSPLRLADSLAAAGSVALYVRRTVPAGETADPSVLTLLHIAFSQF